VAGVQERGEERKENAENRRRKILPFAGAGGSFESHGLTLSRAKIQAGGGRRRA